MLSKKEYYSLSKKERQAFKKKLTNDRKKNADKLSVNVKGLGNTLSKVVGKGSYSLADYKHKPFRTMGSRMGAYLGDQIGTVFGMGDYKIKRNVLLDQGQTPPKFESGPNVTRICHREYLQDILSGPTLVSGATSFNIQTFSINPGLDTSFPWGSTVASNFEEYRITGMMFEYRPMSGNALTSTNTALGTVILATQYNAASSPFVSKQQMENYEYAQSVVPSNQVLHYIECEPRQTAISTELYTRSGAVPSGQDIRLYDWGTFNIATQGMQAANIVLGELWVTYCIELLKPKLYQGPVGNEINYSHWFLTGAISTTNYFGSIAPSTSSNFLPTINTTTIVFPNNVLEGAYLFQYIIYGSSASVNQPTITATTNCSVINLYNNSSVGQIGTVATANVLILNFAILITGPGAVITFSGGTLPSAISRGDLIISQIPINAN